MPDLFSYYGMALLSTGDQDGAKVAFQRALKQNPNDFESNLHMGVLLRHDEKYDEALQYLRHALDMRPGDPGARYQIATIEMARDQLDLACRDLERLVKDSPDFIEAHVSLATVYFRQKRKEDGERERAIDGRPQIAAEQEAARPHQLALRTHVRPENRQLLRKQRRQIERSVRRPLRLSGRAPG